MYSATRATTTRSTSRLLEKVVHRGDDFYAGYNNKKTNFANGNIPMPAPSRPGTETGKTGVFNSGSGRHPFSAGFSKTQFPPPVSLDKQRQRKDMERTTRTTRQTRRTRQTRPTRPTRPTRRTRVVHHHRLAQQRGSSFVTLQCRVPPTPHRPKSTFRSNLPRTLANIQQRISLRLPNARRK